MPTGKHFRNRFFQQKDILTLLVMHIFIGFALAITFFQQKDILTLLVMHIFIGFALAITFLYNALNWVMRKVDPLP